MTDARALGVSASSALISERIGGCESRSCCGRLSGANTDDAQTPASPPAKRSNREPDWHDWGSSDASAWSASPAQHTAAQGAHLKHRP